MEKYDLIIIGGSVAGITAAISCRRRYPDRRILLVRKENKTPIPCAIPYIFGTLNDTERNLIPDTLLKSNNIDIFDGEATTIDRENRVILLKGGEIRQYRKVIIATGSIPIKPQIPGIKKENIYFVEKSVHNLKDMLACLEKAKNIILVGGGFGGVEFAEECRKKGAAVTLVEITR